MRNTIENLKVAPVADLPPSIVVVLVALVGGVLLTFGAAVALVLYGLDHTRGAAAVFVVAIVVLGGGLAGVMWLVARLTRAADLQEVGQAVICCLLTLVLTGGLIGAHFEEGEPFDALSYAFASGLIALLAGLTLGSVASLCGRAWGDRLAAGLAGSALVALALWIGTWVIGHALFPGDPRSPVRGWEGTVAVLGLAWLLLGAFGALSERKRGDPFDPFQVVLLVLWPLFMFALSPFVALPVGAALVSCVRAGELLGRAWGHPHFGAVAGLVAFSAAGAALLWRLRPTPAIDAAQLLTSAAADEPDASSSG